MAHDAHIRLQARNLYVFQGNSLTEAAAQLGISTATVRRWKFAATEAGDDWEKAKMASMIAGKGHGDALTILIQDYVFVHQRIIEDLKTADETPLMERAQTLAKLSDSFTKTMAAATKASPKLSKLAIAQDVIQRLGAYVTENYPEHGAAFVEILDPFGKEVGRAYV